MIGSRARLLAALFMTSFVFFMSHRHFKELETIPGIVYPSLAHSEPGDEQAHEDAAADRLNSTAFTAATPKKQNYIGKAPCQDLPGSSDVGLILKTGAAEIYSKLPIHLVTTLRCASDFLIYSDIEQDFGGYHIHDALANVSEAHKLNDPEFEAYREQTQLHREGQDVALSSKEGWALDKWKFTPMVLDAAKRFPDKKWLVFMEADTYLNWANMLSWLSKFDPTKPYYIGCQTMIAGVVFAHGGSGFMISQATAKKLVEVEEQRKADWEYKVTQTCCGDQILSEAIQEDVGIKLTESFPMVQGRTPTTLDWSPNHWCSPVISWHHMSPNEIDILWHMEQKWIEEEGANTIMLFSDVYRTLVKPQMQPFREDWDNISEQWRITEQGDRNPDWISEESAAAWTSPEACQEACIGHDECVQYSWRLKECRLSGIVYFGNPSKRSGKGGEANDEDSEKIVSGWFLDRIEDYEKSHECRNGPKWILPPQGWF